MKLFLLVLACTSSINAAKDYTGYRLYDVVPRSVNGFEKVQELYRHGFIDILKQTQRGMYVLVGPQAHHIVTRTCRGYHMERCTIISSNFQRNINMETAEQAARKSMARDGKISFTVYERIDTINAYMRELAQMYPGFVTLDSIGKSYQGRQIYLLKISSDGNQNKPAIFIEGGTHAREWISPATVLYIIHQLVENRPNTHKLTDHINWYILPVLNVDGYEYSHTEDRLWRKSRKPTDDDKCIGTDLNRNFDFHWGEEYISSHPCAEDYRGDMPFSQPESIFLKNYISNIKNNLKFYLAVHSFGHSLLYPWGYTSTLPHNVQELHSLGLNFSNASRYSYVVGSVSKTLYTCFGSINDYLMGVLGIELVYAIELVGEFEMLGAAQPLFFPLQQGFILPESRILAVASDTFEGLKQFVRHVQLKFVNLS